MVVEGALGGHLPGMGVADGRRPVSSPSLLVDSIGAIALWWEVSGGVVVVWVGTYLYLLLLLLLLLLGFLFCVCCSFVVVVTGDEECGNEVWEQTNN